MDLIKELGLENFTEEEKNEVLVQLTDSLLKRLMLARIRNLLIRFYMTFTSSRRNHLNFYAIPHAPKIRAGSL